MTLSARRTHQTVTSASFLPILFQQDGKEWAAGGTPERPFHKTHRPRSMELNAGGSFYSL